MAISDMNCTLLTYPLPNGAATPDEFTGKFVQLRWRGQEYLVFAPFERHGYHNQIVGEFVADHGITHSWVSRNGLEVYDLDFKVLGGGRFRADPARRLLILGDNSQAYGRFHSADLAAKIATAGHPWSAFEIQIV